MFSTSYDTIIVSSSTSIVVVYSSAPIITRRALLSSPNVALVVATTRAIPINSTITVRSPSPLASTCTAPYSAMPVLRSALAATAQPVSPVNTIAVNSEEAVLLSVYAFASSVISVLMPAYASEDT